MPDWSLYLVRCRDGSLYTGIATDVERRLAEHRQSHGPGSKYLRGRGPLELVFHKEIGNRSLALRLENKVKKLPRAKKEDLVISGEYIELLLKQISNA
jgi:putative endonuclease